MHFVWQSAFMCIRWFAKIQETDTQISILHHYMDHIFSPRIDYVCKVQLEIYAFQSYIQNIQLD